MREVIREIGGSACVFENDRLIAYCVKEQDAKDFAALPELVEAAKALSRCLDVSLDYTREAHQRHERSYGNYRKKNRDRVQQDIDEHTKAISNFASVLAKMGRKP